MSKPNQSKPNQSNWNFLKSPRAPWSYFIFVRGGGDWYLRKPVEISLALPITFCCQPHTQHSQQNSSPCQKQYVWSNCAAWSTDSFSCMFDCKQFFDTTELSFEYLEWPGYCVVFMNSLSFPHWVDDSAVRGRVFSQNETIWPDSGQTKLPQKDDAHRCFLRKRVCFSLIITKTCLFQSQRWQNLQMGRSNKR